MLPWYRRQICQKRIYVVIAHDNLERDSPELMLKAQLKVQLITALPVTASTYTCLFVYKRPTRVATTRHSQRAVALILPMPYSLRLE